MARAPAARYPTAAELADDLARWRAGEAVSAAAGDRPGGRRRVFGAIGVGAVVLAVGGGLVFAAAGRADRRAEGSPADGAPRRPRRSSASSWRSSRARGRGRRRGRSPIVCRARAPPTATTGAGVGSRRWPTDAARSPSPTPRGGRDLLAAALVEEEQGRPVAALVAAGRARDGGGAAWLAGAARELADRLHEPAADVLQDQLGARRGGSRAGETRRRAAALARADRDAIGGLWAEELRDAPLSEVAGRARAAFALASEREDLGDVFAGVLEEAVGSDSPVPLEERFLIYGVSLLSEPARPAPEVLSTDLAKLQMQDRRATVGRATAWSILRSGPAPDTVDLLDDTSLADPAPPALLAAVLEGRDRHPLDAAARLLLALEHALPTAAEVRLLWARVEPLLAKDGLLGPASRGRLAARWEAVVRLCAGDLTVRACQPRGQEDVAWLAERYPHALDAREDGEVELAERIRAALAADGATELREAAAGLEAVAAEARGQGAARLRYNALRWRAWVEEQRGDLDGVEDVVEGLEELLDDRAALGAAGLGERTVRWEAARHRARLERLRGDPAAALARLRRAGPWDPDHVDPRCEAARALADLGRRAEADEELEAARAGTADPRELRVIAAVAAELAARRVPATEAGR